MAGSRAEVVEVVGPGPRRVLHPRKRFGERSIDYRHYLHTLSTKPQAVRQVLPELLGDLGSPFPAVWQHLEAAHGPREAARVFARVLGELETRGATAVVPALIAALVDRTPLLLAVAASEARADALPTECVPGPLAGIEVSSGRAADYDTWLTGVVG